MDSRAGNGEPPEQLMSMAQTSTSTFESLTNNVEDEKKHDDLKPEIKTEQILNSSSELESKTSIKNEAIKTDNNNSTKEEKELEDLNQNNEEGMTDDSERQEEEEPIIEHLDTSSLYRDPTFAEICSFFNTFTYLLGLKPMPISKLVELFTTIIDGDGMIFLIKRKLNAFLVGKEMIDLHVTLMRKIYLKSARADKWEKSLQKFCSLAPGLESEYRQLQRHNYVDIPLTAKLAIMKSICDSQFDWNLKFKENVCSNTLI
jgi:hypothetical protein